MEIDLDCMACGRAKTVNLAVGEDGLFRCAACGTRFVADYSRTEEDDAFFGQEYIHSKNAWLFEEYRIPAINKINRMLRRFASGNKKNWLDVGSATGYIFKIIPVNEYRKVAAVEPSNFGCSRMRERYPNLEILNGDIDSVTLPPSTYDICTVLDTLYFHPKPQAFLMKVASAMQSDGILVCEVANYKWLKLVGRAATRNTHWKAYYDRKAIMNVIQACGFKILASDNNVGNVPTGVKGALNLAVYHLMRLLYTLSLGAVDYVPKIIVVARKVSN